jgi:thiamine-phosphate pyrophosphorylase
VTAQSCRIYAVVEVAPGAAACLQAALATVDIAALLIGLPPAASFAAAAPLMAMAQRKQVPALIAGDAELAHRLGADGVHLFSTKNGADAHKAARGRLGAGAIVGVDAGISRHEAMSIAEAGADYIAFGAPRHLGDRKKGRVRRDALVAWWAEIFEVPCVAFDVEEAGEARALRAAGADFIAVALPTNAPPEATRALLGEIDAAIRMPAAAL